MRQLNFLKILPGFSDKRDTIDLEEMKRKYLYAPKGLKRQREAELKKAQTSLLMSEARQKKCGHRRVA